MRPPPACPPRVSVIVPTLGEQDRVNALIDHLRVIGYGLDPEIVVVDATPGQATLAAIARPGVIGLAHKPGRAGQLNAGAAASRGEVLLFLHADTRLPSGALADVVAVCRDGRAGAGAFSLGFATDRPLLRLVARLADLRSKLTRAPFGDQAQFIRRDLFFHLGGYPDIPIMEDLALMRLVRRAGARVVILPKRVATSARRYEAMGPLPCLARNLCLQALYLLGAPPAWLARFYPPPRGPKTAARPGPDEDFRRSGRMGGRPEPDPSVGPDRAQAIGPDRDLSISPDRGRGDGSSSGPVSPPAGGARP